jgi:CBS domain-containing protein
MTRTDTACSSRGWRAAGIDMLVKDIMTAEVKTVSSHATIQETAMTMTELGIGCLVVVEKEILVGIITDGDILRHVVAQDRLPSKTKVKEVMTKEVVAVGPETSIEDAADAMTERKVKRLPVVFKNQLIGILSAVDIVAAQPKMMEQIAKLVLLPTKKKIAAG